MPQMSLLCLLPLLAHHVLLIHLVRSNALQMLHANLIFPASSAGCLTIMQGEARMHSGPSNQSTQMHHQAADAPSPRESLLSRQLEEARTVNNMLMQVCAGRPVSAVHMLESPKRAAADVFAGCLVMQT